MRKWALLLLLVLITIGGQLRRALAQPVFTRIFPPEEFAARLVEITCRLSSLVAKSQTPSTAS